MSTRKRWVLGAAIIAVLLSLLVIGVGQIDRFDAALSFLGDAEPTGAARPGRASALRARSEHGRSSEQPGGRASPNRVDDALNPLSIPHESAPRQILPFDDAALEMTERLGPSRVSDTRVDVSLENTCDDVVEVFWVDVAGDEQSYGRIAPGAREDLGTFVGHNWHVRSLDGALVRGLAVESAGRRITCDETHRASRADPSVHAYDPDWPADASPRSVEGADIAVENTCPEGIELRWVDFRGQERTYAALAPGERFTQHSFHGHLWRVRDTRGRTLGDFRASPGATYGTCGGRAALRDG
jgi:hypothetical protein